MLSSGFEKQTAPADLGSLKNRKRAGEVLSQYLTAGLELQNKQLPTPHDGLCIYLLMALFFVPLATPPSPLRAGGAAPWAINLMPQLFDADLLVDEIMSSEAELADRQVYRSKLERAQISQRISQLQTALSAAWAQERRCSKA